MSLFGIWLAIFGAIGLQLGTLALNLDGLLHGAEFQLRIEANRAAALEPDVIARGRLEPLALDHNPVRSEWQRGKHELAGFGGRGLELRVGFALCGSNARGRNARTAGIRYGAGNRAPITLGKQHSREAREKQETARCVGHCSPSNLARVPKLELVYTPLRPLYMGSYSDLT